MGNQRFNEIQKIFHEALELPEYQQDDWIVQRCGEDTDLLNLIQELRRQDLPGDERLEERLKAIDGSNLVGLREGLHVRCPHCQNPIELVECAVNEEVHCPSCGSSFNLVGTESTVSQAPLNDRTIGHFKLQRPLGTGAFGTVWRAKDTELDREVAIKIPRRGNLRPDETEKFLREARTAAQLRHPNIVSVHEVGKEDETLFIVSDLVDGITLTDWLTGQQLTPREAANLCIKLADAIDHAHQNGVIHRDLKPSNILLDRNNEPHLTDFGLAKREAGEITMTIDGQILGTPAYMSPEQARGEGHQVDRRADIYSLGVILFELLTGERPFRGNTRMLIHQLLTKDAPSPRNLVSGIPRDLETICLKCLEMVPDRRFSTAGEFRLELQRWLNGEPIHSRPANKLERSWRWCLRHPARAGMIASLGAAAVAIAAAITSQAYQAELRENNNKLEAALTRETRANQALKDVNAELGQLQEKLNQSYYARRIELAHKELEDFEILQAHSLLRDCEPKLRHWEWFHLYSRYNGERLTIPQEHGVTAVEYSPDGKQILSVTRNGNIRLFDSTTFREVASLRYSGGDVRSVGAAAFRPHGDQLLIAAEVLVDGKRIQQLSLRSMPTLEEVWTITDTIRHTEFIVFSPDGKYFATRPNLATSPGDHSRWTIAIREADSGKLLDAIDAPFGNAVRGIALSNEHFAMATSNGSIRIYDLPFQGRIETVSAPRAGAFVNVFYDPHTEQFVLQRQSQLEYWDPEHGIRPCSLVTDGAEHGYFKMAFSSDGSRCAAIATDEVIVWDLSTGVQLARYSGHLAFVRSLAISPSGNHVVTGGSDCEMKIWRVLSTTDDPNAAIRSFNALDFSASLDGNRVVMVHRSIPTDARESRKDGMLYSLSVLDLSTNKKQVILEDSTSRYIKFALNADGSRLAHAIPGIRNSVQLWNWNTGQATQLRAQDLSPEEELHSSIRHLLLSPDGKLLHVVTTLSQFDKEAKKPASLRREYISSVWDLSGENPQLLSSDRRSQSPTTLVEFSFNSKLALSVGSSVTRSFQEPIQIYDCSIHSLRGPIETQLQDIEFATLSPDGKYVVIAGANPDQYGLDAGAVEFWSTGTGRRERTVSVPASKVVHVSFSLDGMRWSCATSFGEIIAYELTSSEPLWSARTESVNSLITTAFSPDRKRHVTSSASILEIRDAESGEKLLTIDDGALNSKLTRFSSSGKHLITGDELHVFSAYGDWNIVPPQSP